MAGVACCGQVQPVTVQSKAVRSRGKKLDTVLVDSKIRRPTISLVQMTETTILNDCVEAAIMLDYNVRDVAAAWY